MTEDSQIKPVSLSIEKQTTALQLKYLLSLSSQKNENQLINSLNKLYPFTQYPLSAAPPTELFETADNETKIITNNINKQLNAYSFIIITGGITVEKGTHFFTENRYIDAQIGQKLIFSITKNDTIMKALAGTCYIRIHNIWIQMAQKKHKQRTQKQVKQKLLNIPFFANLSFGQFEKCCKKASIRTLGPQDILVESQVVPYHMYIVMQGQLVFEKNVKFIKDRQLWYDIKNQIQRIEDNTCEMMFYHLVKEPKANDKTFQVIFQIKSVSEGQIICARQTLTQQALPYLIRSTLKTKLIELKYPDLYNLNGQRLAQIRAWPKVQVDEVKLRKDYYYQVEWKEFKEKLKKQNTLNKIEKTPFEAYLRKEIDLTQQKHYFFPNKVGTGNVIEGNPAKISKFKIMAYQQQ